MYTVSQFAKKVGVSVKTLQKWDRIGVLRGQRTVTNRRYHTDEELARALRLPRVSKERRTIGYCRVSSQAQKPDLLNQRRALEQWCERQHIVVDEWIMEIGGGLNFERKQILCLVDTIIYRQVDRLDLAPPHLLTTVRYTLLHYICP